MQLTPTADINNDGKSDIVTANYDPGCISLLLGNGDGTFQNPVSYNTESGSAAFSISDINLDGKADIIVAYYDLNSISVLLGYGNGTFQSPTNYNINGGSGVVIGDINLDGRPDVVTSNYNNNIVSVLLNIPAVAISTLSSCISLSQVKDTIFASLKLIGTITTIIHGKYGFEYTNNTLTKAIVANNLLEHYIAMKICGPGTISNPYCTDSEDCSSVKIKAPPADFCIYDDLEIMTHVEDLSAVFICT